MAQSTVGIRIAVDAGQAQAQVNALADTVDKLNEKLAEATDAGDWTGAANITATINNLAMAQDNMARMPVTGVQGGGGQGGITTQPALGDRIVEAANQISQSMIQLGKGDFGGAAISATSGMGSGMRGVGKEIRDANPSSQLGKALGIAGVALQVISAGANAIHQNTLAYEEALPHMREYNAIFSPANTQQIKASLAKQGKAATEENIAEEQVKLNTKNEMRHYNAAAAMRWNTNLSNIELLDAARNETRYGKISAIRAMDIAAENAKFAFANSADMGLVQDLRGTARKFGDKDDATRMANSVLVNSGASKGQMDEFLQAMKSVMEDGIANGFLKSSRDVAESMTMFARLSSNSPFWTGEQGAKRMISMGDAVKSATGLDDVRSAIMFSAAEDALAKMSKTDKGKAQMAEYVGKDKAWSGTYIDTQLMLEKGVTVPFMNSYFDKINNLYSEGDVTGKIEEYKRDFNLNYTGATQLYEMAGKRNTFKTDEEYKKAVDEILENKNYKDNETRLVNAVEEIKKAMVGTGEKTFGIKIAGLEKIENITRAIYLSMSKKDNLFLESGLYNENGTDNEFHTSLRNQAKQLYGRDYLEVIELLEGFQELSTSDIRKVNAEDALNTKNMDEWKTSARMILATINKKGDLNETLTDINAIKTQRSNIVGMIDEIKSSVMDDSKTLMPPDYNTSKATDAFMRKVNQYALEYENVGGKWVRSANDKQEITNGERLNIITAFRAAIKGDGTKTGEDMAQAFIDLLSGTNINLNAIFN